MSTYLLMDRILQPSVLKVSGHFSPLGFRPLKTLWVYGPPRILWGSQELRSHPLFSSPGSAQKAEPVVKSHCGREQSGMSSESTLIPIACWLCSAHCSAAALSGLSYLYARNDCCSWSPLPFRSTWHLYCRCKTGPCVEGKAGACFPHLVSQK